MSPFTSSAVLLSIPLAIAATQGTTSAAPPQAGCNVVQIVPPDFTVGLDGMFLYIADVQADDPHEIIAHMLVLDGDGEVVEEISVSSGVIVKVGVRDNIYIKEHKTGYPFQWHINAPGVLFRTQVRQGFESDIAYCGPFASVRVDQPEVAVFTSTTADSSGLVDLVIGVAEMIPETVRVYVDCVDILQAVGGALPGGPFNGVTEIAGAMVTVEEFRSDFNQGRLTFRLRDMPGGTHLVKVTGSPSYIDLLPLGYVNWNRPLGVLEHERPLYMFRTDITSPANGSSLPLQATQITGTITHGLEIASLRVHGANVALGEPVLIPGDECMGDSYQIDFAVSLPTAHLAQDFASGDDAVSSLDPGRNFVSALAADVFGFVSNDRVRFNLGNVEFHVEGGGAGSGGAASGTCKPTTEIPGFVRNGLAVSLSEAALEQSIRNSVLPDLQDQLKTKLDNLVGNSVSGLLDPCLSSVAAAAEVGPHALHAAISKLEPIWLQPVQEPVKNITTLQPAAGQPKTADGGRSAGGVSGGALTFDAIPNQSVNIGKGLTVQLSASHSDGDAVTFTIISAPSNSHIAGSKFEWVPNCEQIGGHTVTIQAAAGGLTSNQSFVATVSNHVESVAFDATFTSVIYHPNNFDLRTRLISASEVGLDFETGPMEFNLHSSDCVIDCLLCCLSYSVNVKVSLSNIRVRTSLTPQQLLCGVSSADQIAAPEVIIDGLDVDFSGLSIGGVLGVASWLTGPGLVANLLILFGVGDSLLDLFLADNVVDQVRASLTQSIVDQFEQGISFSGMQSMQFSTALPGGIPLQLETQSSDLPVLLPETSMSMGLFSRFTPTISPDPVGPWLPTFSGLPHVGTLGADMLLAVSDDAINQMMASLTATGRLRHQFDGLTVGDVAPGVSHPPHITPQTPILLTIDAAQDSDGRGIPPIFGLVDDPSTPDVIEMKVRTQLAVRGILPKGNPVPNDRAVWCSCLSPSALSGIGVCGGQACLLHESVLKLNFLVEATIEPQLIGLAINFVVTEVQELDRDKGFNSYEAGDFTNDEPHIVATSADSPLLGMIRDAVNDSMAPFLVPAFALTLNGNIVVTNPRLMSATIDGAGHGHQDYFGIAADLEP